MNGQALLSLNGWVCMTMGSPDCMLMSPFTSYLLVGTWHPSLLAITHILYNVYTVSCVLLCQTLPSDGAESGLQQAGHSCFEAV